MTIPISQQRVEGIFFALLFCLSNFFGLLKRDWEVPELLVYKSDYRRAEPFSVSLMSVVTPAIEFLIFPNFLVLLCFYFIEAEEKKLREASLAASSRLKRALLKEKETKDCLQKSLNELQVWTLKQLATFTACEKKNEK